MKSIQNGENTALMQVNQLCLSSNEVIYILKVVSTNVYEASMATKHVRLQDAVASWLEISSARFPKAAETGPLPREARRRQGRKCLDNDALPNAWG